MKQRTITGNLSALFIVFATVLFVLSNVFISETIQQELEGFRVVQYDKGNQPYGCRFTGLNSPIATLSGAGSSLSAARNVIIVNLDEVLGNNTKTSFSTIQNQLNREDVSGMLIVIPKAELTFELIEQFRPIEKQLLLSKFEKPIYFVFENDKTREILNNFQTTGEVSILDESYQAVVTESEAKPIEQIPIVNIQSVLNGKVADKSASTIGIVAHYDTINAIPGLSNGVAGSSSTGMIGLLEISRLFQKLYAVQATKGSQNLLFVLTGGSRLGFAGTKHWLKQLDQRILNRLDFVLCLDSLTSMIEQQKLYIHISEKTNDKNVINLYKHFVQTAKQMQIDLQFIEKKVEREYVWEHEVFSKKGILSATISTQSTPASSMLTKTSALDVTSPNLDQLKKNIKFISESLARHIYDIDHNIRFFEDENGKFIQSFVKAVGKTSRFTPVLNKDSDMVKTIKNVSSIFISINTMYIDHATILH